MKINEVENDDDIEEKLFEMSNLRKIDTGLPVNIYISSGGPTNQKHGPRLKAMINIGDKFDPYKTVSIMLKRDITENDIVGYHKLPAKIIDSLRQYINLNYDVLMAHWDDKIGSVEVIQQLKRLD